MTEGQFNAKLVKELRQRLGPGAVVFKHADAYTAGIPDISVTLNDRTLWLECKLTTNKKWFEPLQMAMLQKLRGYYIIWSPETKRGFQLLASQAPEENGNWTTFALLVNQIIREVKDGF